LLLTGFQRQPGWREALRRAGLSAAAETCCIGHYSHICVLLADVRYHCLRLSVVPTP